MQTRDRLDGLAVGLMVVLTLVWGLNQVSIKVANTGLQPVFSAGLRSTLAALAVFGWCRLRGIRLFGRDGTLAGGIAAGLLFGAEFVLLYLSLDYTTVSHGIIFFYTSPFFVAAGAHFLLPGERMTVVRFAGLLAALAGLLIAFSDGLSLPSRDTLFGDFLCLAAGGLWGATTLTIKATPLKSAAPEKVLLYQLAVSAVLLMALAPLFGPFLRVFTPLTAGIVAFQVLIVVSVSFLAWFWLLRRYPAGPLSAFTFLTPVFGVIFGALILAEPLGWRVGAALALVAFGIYLVSLPPKSVDAATARG